MSRNLIDLPSLIESDDIRVNILQWDGSTCLRLTFIGCFSGKYRTSHHVFQRLRKMNTNSLRLESLYELVKDKYMLRNNARDGG